MQNLSKDELLKLIGDKVYKIREDNKELQESLELPTITAQIAVRATLEILQDFGIIKLPNE